MAAAESDFVASSSAVRINILWFTSLTLSLSALLFSVLCLQWLHEYPQDSVLPPKSAFELRQRCYEGLKKWRVPTIVSSLPVLIHLAAALFLAGLLDLLWSLHPIVATALSIIIGIPLLLLLLTTILPTIQSFRRHSSQSCAYKSLQAWGFSQCTHLLVRRAAYVWNSLGSRWRSFPLWDVPMLAESNWASHDIHGMMSNNDYLARGIIWINTNYFWNPAVRNYTFACLKDMHSSFFPAGVGSGSNLPSHVVSNIIAHFQAEELYGRVYVPSPKLALSSALCTAGLTFTSYLGLFPISQSDCLPILKICLREVDRAPDSAPVEVFEFIAGIISKVSDLPKGTFLV